MILNPPRAKCRSFSFKNAFPADDCAFLQKKAVFEGHFAGTRRTLQEAVRAQESRALMYIHKKVINTTHLCFRETLCESGRCINALKKRSRNLKKKKKKKNKKKKKKKEEERESS